MVKPSEHCSYGRLQSAPAKPNLHSQRLATHLPLGSQLLGHCDEAVVLFCASVCIGHNPLRTSAKIRKQECNVVCRNIAAKILCIANLYSCVVCIRSALERRCANALFTTKNKDKGSDKVDGVEALLALKENVTVAFEGWRYRYEHAKGKKRTNDLCGTVQHVQYSTVLYSYCIHFMSTMKRSSKFHVKNSPFRKRKMLHALAG